MLPIMIQSSDLWDEKNQEFIHVKEQSLNLEHSLVSISKWESKWHKPFMTREEKTYEETIDYIRCMTLSQNVDPKAYYALSNENMSKIEEYIFDPMTATWFSEKEKTSSNGETVTAELIYYWMIELKIPIEFQKWHLNRLMTLIRVCRIKSQPEKKMSKQEILSRNRALNATRKKQLNTKG